MRASQDTVQASRIIQYCRNCVGAEAGAAPASMNSPNTHGMAGIEFACVDAGQNVGIKDEDDNIWLVSFMQYDIGYFDLEACRVELVENPFGPKVLAMSPV
jgi:hypothetical protein